ncbi:MAG: hypothetical protein DUD39_07740 [Coriobacteriaceae bacterium]|nr:MAG: hypothetical protein DUD39_07740 [Coriobacteriaceae bacterium]
MILFVLDSIIFELLRIPFTLCHDSFLHLLYIMLYEKVIFKASYLYASTMKKKSLTKLQLAKREELDPAKTHLRTARACQMGEALQDVYSCADRKSAARAPERLCSWMMHSAVAEMKSVARTLRKEREGILNWWKRGSTNSFLEGLNSVVQSARSIARGFRSIAYFRTMIFLRLGRLDFTA